MKSLRVILLILCLVLAVAASTLLVVRFYPKVLLTAQPADIERLVHNYLLRRPEILIEMSKLLQHKQEQFAAKQITAAVKANAEQLFKNSALPVIGNSDAKVILVEFFDYQCPHCKPMSKAVDELITTQPDLQVKFVEWPIFGDDSLIAAKAALAANRQRQFYAMHKALFNAELPLNEEKVLQLAKKLNLDLNKFKQAMASKAIAEEIKNNFLLAKQLNLVGTPVVVLANKTLTKFELLPGAVPRQELQHKVDHLR